MTFASIILAAGEGRRLGDFKPLLPLNGDRVIDRVIHSASAVCSQIMVVGGSQFQRLKTYLDSTHPEVTLIFNPLWKTGGMFSSVQIGLNNLACPAFIHPVDIPGPGENIYQVMVSTFKKHPSDVVRPVFKGRSGHPVLLSTSSIRTVCQSPSNTNLRSVLSRLERFDVEVESEIIHYDFDTPEQFESLKALLLQMN